MARQRYISSNRNLHSCSKVSNAEPGPTERDLTRTDPNSTQPEADPNFTRPNAIRPGPIRTRPNPTRSKLNPTERDRTRIDPNSDQPDLCDRSTLTWSSSFRSRRTSFKNFGCSSTPSLAPDAPSLAGKRAAALCEPSLAGNLTAAYAPSTCQRNGESKAFKHDHVGGLLGKPLEITRTTWVGC